MTQEYRGELRKANPALNVYDILTTTFISCQSASSSIKGDFHGGFVCLGGFGGFDSANGKLGFS